MATGAGYTIDYIWQYNDDYATVVHPDDHWMPLSSVLVWLSVSVFGIGAREAILPFLLLGALLPVISYWGGRQLDLSHGVSLIAAGFAAVVPELVMNSARTDTTVPNALLVCLSIVLLNQGFKRGEALAFVASGIAAGVSYLNRSENILLLPMFVVTLIALRGQHWQKALLMPLVAALVVAPWLARNVALNGTISTPTTINMFFLTDVNDHYIFDAHLSLQTYFASVTPAQMIGKRLFEMAAGIKMMITTLDVVLPVLVIGGGLLLLRDRSRWRAVAPTAILLLGVFVFYTVLVPYKAQAGSLKKAYLTLIPLLIPVGVYALDRVIANRRYLVSGAVISIALMGINGFELVRADQTMARNYLVGINAMRDVARTLPDGGDGLVLMTQDPFILSYVGLSSIVFPQNDRDTLIAVAERYGVDYLLMPADRPNLDGILQGDDPRFVRVADVPGTQFVFYRIEAP
jgi:4-amino-4-deoxy-L-arabinose transferase-like glycosyltransferase